MNGVEGVFGMTHARSSTFKPGNSMAMSVPALPAQSTVSALVRTRNFYIAYLRGLPRRSNVEAFGSERFEWRRRLPLSPIVTRRGCTTLMRPTVEPEDVEVRGSDTVSDGRKALGGNVHA